MKNNNCFSGTGAFFTGAADFILHVLATGPESVLAFTFWVQTGVESSPKQGGAVKTANAITTIMAILSEKMSLKIMGSPFVEDIEECGILLPLKYCTSPS
jgi:hypothetical protein